MTLELICEAPDCGWVFTCDNQYLAEDALKHHWETHFDEPWGNDE